MKKYDLITPTSMGVRLTPQDRQPVGITNTFTMHATSAESNVLNTSASLGLSAHVLTGFVKDSPIAAFIKGELRRRNITFEGPEIDQGGPWGYRHQFNLADAGFGVRGPRVHNDRAGEVGRTLKVEDFDVDRLFKRDGVRMMHMSGLFAALSPETAKLCVKLAEVAKENGTLVSFDLNHRASFWAGREEELHAAFTRIASLSDILIGNEEDYQLALGVHGPEAGGKEIGDNIEEFKQMIAAAQAAFPNVKVFATTLRQVLDANRHLWGAILYKDGQWHLAPQREIQVLDRIGGGDGFVGGLLYSLLRGFDGEKCLQFAWSTGALATTMLEDYASPVDEKQVMAVWAGNARVLR
ncbi:MAG: sugar kinase [Clostridiales bacterium]|jgi:2-dehydro-3-deoxygluconokinase|nr:sugar kinase [Clostridiales bacterium]